MRLVDIVIDDECATYVGLSWPELQGSTGRIEHETPTGKWIMFRDTFVGDERVDTAWAYEYQETILPKLFGDAMIKPFVTLFFPNAAIRDRRRNEIEKHRAIARGSGRHLPSRESNQTLRPW